jgi:hypothetical protein
MTPCLPGLPLVALASAAAAVVLVAPRLEAAMAREVSLRHLVTVADAVVEGTPEENTSVWEEIPGVGRRIVTYTRVSVGQVVYGPAAPKDVWVRTLGGVVGDIGQRVEGEAVLVPGERSVLFLKATAEGTHHVVEMAQGHYLVRLEGGAARLRPSPHHGALVKGRGEAKDVARPARDVLTGKPVVDAISAIRVERKAAGRLAMNPRNLTRALSAAALGIAALAPAAAHAFCRTWSCDPLKETCPADPDNPSCPVGGTRGVHFPLYWPQSCVGFSINQNLASQLIVPKAGQTDAEALLQAQTRIAKLTNQAFASWQRVTCSDAGGLSPTMTFSNLGFAECDRHEFNQNLESQRKVPQGNANLIVFREDEWPYVGSANTLALTTLTFNTRTGEIYDADMEINAVKGKVRLTTDDADPDSDLLSILTHEAGHFIGIAHSPDPEATMFATYEPKDTKMRTLEEDDKAAICHVYPPTRTNLPECDPTPRHGYSTKCGVPADEPSTPKGCAVVAVGNLSSGSGGPGAPWGALALGVAAAGAAARRRRGVGGG